MPGLSCALIRAFGRLCCCISERSLPLVISERGVQAGVENASGFSDVFVRLHLRSDTFWGSSVWVKAFSLDLRDVCEADFLWRRRVAEIMTSSASSASLLISQSYLKLINSQLPQLDRDKALTSAVNKMKLANHNSHYRGTSHTSGRQKEPRNIHASYKSTICRTALQPDSLGHGTTSMLGHDSPLRDSVLRPPEVTQGLLLIETVKEVSNPAFN